MRRMMQSMVRQLEYYKFNALLILLTTFLTHEQYFRVFGITVNPHDSLSTSTVSYSDGFVGNAAAHHINNYDYNIEFINGPNKFTGSAEAIDTTSFDSLYDDSNQQDYSNDHIDKTQTDLSSENLKMLSMHRSAFEMPNFFSDRISVNARIISPQLSPPPPSSLYMKQPPRTPLLRSPAPPQSDGFIDRLKVIYPGTLWCGDGNMAKYQNEVGLFRNTDICCKQHDECPAFIKAGSEFKGLRNTAFFTRSHCDCDWKFYNCLKRTNSLISNKIGYAYFNILRPQCFRKEYPIVGCRKWINKKCYAYMVDDNQLPKWQWFENQLF